MTDNDPSGEDPFGAIADEFVEAYRRGQRPSVEEFARRYPAHAAEIRDMLPALALMEQAKSTGDTPAQPPPAKARVAAQYQQLGDYQILREVGRGGMGVVYEAQQLSLGRHVAIKVLPAHALLDPRHLGRFQREARSAAKLHHTNIVPVFGVGEHDGLHYYVMQFIQGLGLDVVLDELRRLRQPGGRPPSVVASGLLSGEFRPPDSALTTAPEARAPARPDPSSAIHLPGQSDTSALTESGGQYWQSVARVGVQVADALAHAASQGVLHRDIKPSNLLLDDGGNVWVTDFGLAKADDGDNLTHTGDIVGTLRYMAPERFNGQGDLRSDVYSLGLTLYELLTLRPAFDESDRNKLIKQVMHDEPTRPRKVNPAVPRDLETVVLKAIARDPAHRYQTPAEMADDLKRFLEDRPVRARPVSETEKAWRWCRRNPLPASLLAGLVLMFLLGFAGVSWQWRAALRARRDEAAQRGKAETARDEASDARNAAARQAAALLLDRGVHDAQAGEPARALHLFVQALRALPPDDPLAAPLDRAGRLNLAAWAEAVPALEQVWPSGGRFSDAAFSADGERVALAVGTDEVRCYRTDTGHPACPPLKVPVGHGTVLEFAPDGRSLWVSSTLTGVDGKWSLRRLRVAGGPADLAIACPGPIDRVAVTPDGRHVVAVLLGLHPDDRGPRPDAEGTRLWHPEAVVAWDAATGEPVRKVALNPTHHPWHSVRLRHSYLGLSQDGKSVTLWFRRGAGYDGVTFAVVGTDAPRWLGPHPTGAIDPWALHFQPHLLSGLAVKGGEIHRWSAANPGVLGPGVPAAFRHMHDGPSADGRSVVSVAEGRVFDTGAWPPRASGTRLAHPGWQNSTSAAKAVSRDGRFAATWLNADGGDTRLWRLPRPVGRPPLSPAEFARQPERENQYHFGRLDSRGAGAALWWRERGPNAHGLRYIDVATGAVRETAVRHGGLIRDVAFSPDGRYFATGSDDYTARVWEAATGRPAGPPLPHVNYVAGVAFSPDGKTLAAGDFGPRGEVKLWDWRAGTEARPPLVHDDIVLSVTFSPDGRHLAAVKAGDWSKVPELVVWDVAAGTVAFRVRHQYALQLLGQSHTLPPFQMAQFRPDGKAIAARDGNGGLNLWEVPTGTRVNRRALDGAGATRFSPDGRVVAAAANQGVRLLSGDTLDPLPGGFLPHPDPVQDVAFSPDGALLLTAHVTGSAQLWDVATCKPVGPPAVLLGPVRAVTFTPDGRTCVAVAADGTARRRPVPEPVGEPDLGRLDDRVARVTGQRMDDNQGLDAVPLAEWQALRERLPGLVTPRADGDWHDAGAADAEQDGDAFGAGWHLDRLAKARPKDWTIPARRGRLLAAAGRLAEARAAYDAAAELAPSPQLLADWLRAAADDEEAAGRLDRGLWNLDRAQRLTQDDWVVYAARAAQSDRAGDLEQGRADLDAAVRLGAESTVIVQAVERGVTGEKRPVDWPRLAGLMKVAGADPRLTVDDRYHLAIACLKVGDPKGYAAACAGIAKRMPAADVPLTLGDAVSGTTAFTIGAKATDDWAVPLGWADRVLTRLAERAKADPSSAERNKPWRHAFLALRGALLYRAGKGKEAAATLREATALHATGGGFAVRAHLALAEQALGRADEARAAAAGARKARPAQKDLQPWDRAEVELLAAELDAAVPAGK